MTAAQILRAEIACDPRRSVVVEACAGSGKTWLLTARILRILLAGVRPGRILALTFTEAAAEEMKRRVRSELRRLGGLGRQSARASLADIGLSGEELETALLRLPGLAESVLLDPHLATICTFHSWYRRLLAASPLDRARLKTYRLTGQPQVFRRICRLDQLEMLAREAAGLMAALLKRMGLKAMEELIDGAIDRRSGYAVGGLPLVWTRLLGRPATIQQQTESILQHEQTQAEALRQRWGQTWQPAAIRLWQAFRQIPPGHSSLKAWMHGLQPETLDADELRAALCREFLTQKGTVRAHLLTAPLKKLLPGDCPNQLAALAESLVRFAQEQAVIRHETTEQLLLLAAGLCLARRSQLESERDEVDFDGLESLAIRSVCGPEGGKILSRLDLQVEQILVDEFQDTSPAQWALLRAWLENYAQGSGLEPPGVFLVGDPKQSIYAFRGAQSGVFSAAAAWLQQNFHAVLLQTDTTRRCGPEVVAGLNSLMAEQGAWAPQPIRPHSGLTHASQAHGSGLAAVIAVDGPETADSDPVRQEGQRIGQALRQLRSQRPGLAWSDIRLLVRSRTNLSRFEAGLQDAGVPFLSDRGGGLLNQPHIRDLLALCQWLVYPWASSERAQAQMSTFLQLDRRDWISSREPLWREAAQTWPVQEVLQMLISDLELGRTAVSGQMLVGAQQRADLEALVALALEADDGRSPSLGRFLDQMRLLAEAPDQEAPALGALPDSLSGVRIQTIHGSKGLESPVVVLVGLGTRGRNPSDLVWVEDWSEDWQQFRGIRLLSRKLAEFPPVLLSESLESLLRLAEREAQLDLQQEQNLRYVALTRAQQVVLLSTRHPDGAKSEVWQQALAALQLLPVAGLEGTDDE